MNTRSYTNKSKVDEQFKTAITEADKHKKTKIPTIDILYTSTPVPLSGHSFRKIDFSADESTFEKTLVPNIISETEFGETNDETVKPFKYKKKFIKVKEGAEIMATHNPFATLKYAVEAVSFFDGKNIPLNYFIEGCEEAKGMLPAEAEPQFAKILRTRIVGKARQTIRDIDFKNVN